MAHRKRKERYLHLPVSLSDKTLDILVRKLDGFTDAFRRCDSKSGDEYRTILYDEINSDKFLSQRMLKIIDGRRCTMSRVNYIRYCFSTKDYDIKRYL